MQVERVPMFTANEILVSDTGILWYSNGSRIPSYDTEYGKIAWLNSNFTWGFYLVDDLIDNAFSLRPINSIQGITSVQGYHRLDVKSGKFFTKLGKSDCKLDASNAHKNNYVKNGVAYFRSKEPLSGSRTYERRTIKGDDY